MPFLYFFSVCYEYWSFMKENAYQAELIKKIKRLLPSCIVLKNDANYIQGFPDLLILYNDTWVGLECKRSASASRRPNQEYYVNLLNEMSHAWFIYPENEEEVLNELCKALGA